MKYFYFLLSFLAIVPATLKAQSSKDYSVLASATVSKTAPVITLHWPLDPGATSYKIWRKAKTATTWGAEVKTLAGSAIEFADMTASPGQAYEYKIEKKAGSTNYTGFGYVYAGAEVPAIENRDKVILLIDNHFKDSLATEIARLKMDMLGDGWQVISHYVNKTDKVTDVKKIISQAYNADPTHVKSLFLLGHIPVPYSGDYAIDHHSPDHTGAWPADAYYGSMDESSWTDYIVDNDAATRVENDNVPSDGKYDNDILPSDVKLQIGRVDFYNLPLFKTTETELMRRYLNKDHNWRVKNVTAKNKAVIEDNFGGMNGEAFAASGFYNFSAMFGDTNVFVAKYLKSITADTFLWSYGCGGGSYTSVGGVVSTADFVTKKANTVFTMLFGSYHGDWDSKDNILRAPLAGNNMVLTSVWSGRPHWNFHHMALGENIGYSAIVTQNDYTNYFRVRLDYHPVLMMSNENRFVTPALLGDPTLRMHVVYPPAISEAKPINESVSITWKKSKDAEEYYIYNTDNLDKPFVRIGKVSATDSVYIDATAQNNGNKIYYMVRAAKLEQSASGTYYNLSQGSIDSVTMPTSIRNQKLITNLNVYPNPSQNGNFTIELSANAKSNYTLLVTDITGREVYKTEINAATLQSNRFTVNLQNKAKGIYTLQLNNAETAYTQKIIYR